MYHSVQAPPSTVYTASTTRTCGSLMMHKIIAAKQLRTIADSSMVKELCVSMMLHSTRGHAVLVAQVFVCHPVRSLVTLDHSPQFVSVWRRAPPVGKGRLLHTIVFLRAIFSRLDLQLSPSISSFFLETVMRSLLFTQLFFYF